MHNVVDAAIIDVNEALKNKGWRELPLHLYKYYSIENGRGTENDTDVFREILKTDRASRLRIKQMKESSTNQNKTELPIILPNKAFETNNIMDRNTVYYFDKLFNSNKTFSKHKKRRFNNTRNKPKKLIVKKEEKYMKLLPWSKNNYTHPTN